MAEVSNQQLETTVPMDEDLDVPHMDDGLLAAIRSSSGERAASESDESTSESSSYYSSHTGSRVHEFIEGQRRCDKNIYERELREDEVTEFRQILPLWTTFLHSEQGIQAGYVNSLDINANITQFITRVRRQEHGAQWTKDKKVIKEWLPEWNMFVQARAGKTLVTRVNLCLTIVGFLLYLLDLGSDIYTSMIYVSKRQFDRAVVTLIFVYGIFVVQTIIKWSDGQLRCTGAADRLYYLAAMLVNWLDVQQYWALCQLEWKMYNSATRSARLIPEWHQRRLNVALLKFMEGIWEACPQAMLQLYFLVPDLYGDLTWTDYYRIASASLSLCTAGAALVNREKFDIISNYSDVPLGELAALHVWAVPVTVSRLLSVALLLTLNPYWIRIAIFVHLVLLFVFCCCSTTGVTRALDIMCLDVLQFLISPFAVTDSATTRCLYHVTHIPVNTLMLLEWARRTPLKYAHPALYAAIICVNAVMFVVGLVGWQVHEYYRRR